ncbi:hypothetical protein CBR_g55240 [Chara braunii]|uniref:ribose-phosphate diphosphokinase n=1 Tax=Chara braunii TaxID=69332 RepID=A0A388MD17_CHABU|nr:hypothetical protein CBR_g55240 [Chara braunii]|eukprot:GBG92359.1 hypothetical protein CBR_g55240 [Chara braunii]
MAAIVRTPALVATLQAQRLVERSQVGTRLPRPDEICANSIRASDLPWGQCDQPSSEGRRRTPVSSSSSTNAASSSWQDVQDDTGRRKRIMAGRTKSIMAGGSRRRSRKSTVVGRSSAIAGSCFMTEGDRDGVSIPLDRQWNRLTEVGTETKNGGRSFAREKLILAGMLGGRGRHLMTSFALSDRHVARFLTLASDWPSCRRENDKSADLGIIARSGRSRKSVFVSGNLSECAALTTTANEAAVSHNAAEIAAESSSSHGAAIYPDPDLYATSAVSSEREVGKHVCLFYCDETKDLAQKIAAENDKIELQTVQWGRFADGFPNLFIPNAHGIRNRHVAFLASFSSPAVIFEQLSVIYALPRMFVSSFTLVLPFFPTGTVERMEDEGDIATAFTLSRILSNIPLSRGGPTSVVIFDIHALQERFYFGDYVHPFFESGVPLLKEHLSQLPDFDNVTIAFPDEGAWKRFYKQFAGFDTIICTKVRDGNKRLVRLKEGNPQGRHVVIVDDLVQSGSTLVECQKVLAGLGASCVSAYATHGVFPNQSWKRFLHNGADDTDGGGFAHFWITDSCAQTVNQVQGRQPFEILSLAKLIAAALQI